MYLVYTIQKLKVGESMFVFPVEPVFAPYGRTPNTQASVVHNAP